MRIESHGLNPVSTAQPVGRNAGVQRVQPKGAPETLELSVIGRLVLSARQALQSVPEVRERLVRDLSARLASGRYQTDPEAVATAMLAD